MDVESNGIPITEMADTTPKFFWLKSRWIVGVDLGQSNDWTAICAIEHQDGVLDFNTPYERHTGTGRIPQKKEKRLLVKHLERLPRGLSYPAQIDRIAQLTGRPPLCGDENTPRCDLIVDDTGVGRPVSDMMIDRGLKPKRVTITAGLETTPQGRDRWHVSKSVLISGLDAALHGGLFKIAAALTESGALKDELLDFERSVSAAGRATYQARTGQHDDLVLSIAIAVWWARRGPQSVTPQFSTYSSGATQTDFSSWQI